MKRILLLALMVVALSGTIAWAEGPGPHCDPVFPWCWGGQLCP